MTWTTPIDPPADGSAITRPFYITYVKDNLGHLRTVTGGDPTVAGQILVATGAGAAAWTTALTLTSLLVGAGGIATNYDAYVGGSITTTSVAAINGTFTGAMTISGSCSVAAALVVTGNGTFGGAVTCTTYQASAAGTVGAPAFAFTSVEGGGTDGFYESGSHTPAIAVSGVQIQRWLAGTTIITAATQITGQVTITGSGTYTGTWAAASDRRLKTAIMPAQNELPKIMALQPITYRQSALYRQLYGAREDTNRRYHGFIAQDMADVFPDVVAQNQDDNGMLAVDYARLVVPLVAAVQELAAANTALTARVAALELVP